jgi:DNA-binding transcriptional LysR family regulator
MRLQQIDLNKLQVFFEIAECGGMSAAARLLALTPSALSQSLASLEASLEVKLFDRVGRRLVLTREGRLLQSRYREHRVGLQHVLEEISGEQRAVRGTVRVGLFLGFPREPLAGFLGDFARRFPAASTRLVYGSRGELDEALADGRVDFVFAFDRGEAGRQAATRLFRQELVLAGTPALAPARGQLAFASLATLPVVDYYQSEPLIQRWIAHHYRRRTPQLDVRAWAATTNLVFDLVLDGVGVGVLPRYLVEPQRREGRLRLLRTGRRELVDDIWLKERAGGYRGPALEAFRDAALEAFQDPTATG